MLPLLLIPSWAEELSIPSWAGPEPVPHPPPCAGAAGPSVRGAGGPSVRGAPQRGPSTWGGVGPGPGPAHDGMTSYTAQEGINSKGNVNSI